MGPEAVDASVTGLVSRALDLAREVAADADQARRTAPPGREPAARADALKAQRDVVVIEAALRALAGQVSPLSPGPEPVQDAEGFDLRPDPLSARTTAELTACVRAYRQWSGGPSLRTMAERSGKAVSHSTIRAILSGGTAPSLAQVTAIIRGCGGSMEEQRNYATAWRRLTSEAQAGAYHQGNGMRRASPAQRIDEASWHWEGPSSSREADDQGRTRPPQYPQPASPQPPPRQESAQGPDVPFRRLLRQSRDAAGLSRQELAAASGISEGTISDLEHGTAPGHGQETALLLASALNLTAAMREEFMLASRSARRSRKSG
jgi:DNA-binding XRE family transcriptional regulator